MSGPNSQWDRPVDISIPTTGSHKVGGPFEALVHLTEHWPTTQGLCFVKARSACRGALAGHPTLEEARLAFEAAALEAQRQIGKPHH